MTIWSVPPSKPTARLPATTPTRISISATEIPVPIEIKLAISAKPIQTAAINQIFSSIKNSFRLEGVISSSRFSHLCQQEGKLHCPCPESTAVLFPINCIREKWHSQSCPRSNPCRQECLH